MHCQIYKIDMEWVEFDEHFYWNICLGIDSTQYNTHDATRLKNIYMHVFILQNNIIIYSLLLFQTSIMLALQG
jgi:hypothetical protein